MHPLPRQDLVFVTAELRKLLSCFQEIRYFHDNTMLRDPVHNTFGCPSTGIMTVITYSITNFQVPYPAFAAVTAIWTAVLTKLTAAGVWRFLFTTSVARFRSALPVLVGSEEIWPATDTAYLV